MQKSVFNNKSIVKVKSIIDRDGKVTVNTLQKDQHFNR